MATLERLPEGPGPAPGAGTRLALGLGWAIPAVFLATNLACGWWLGHYSHLSRLVSELGALGTPTRFLFSTGLVLCSVLSLLFVAGLLRACRAVGASPAPILPILAYTLSIGGAGLFPLPLRLHLLLGMPSILLILSPLLALVLWRGQERALRIRPLAVAALVLMAGGFLAFRPDVLPDLPGLKQRFFHVGWAVWFMALAHAFRVRVPRPG